MAAAFSGHLIDSFLQSQPRGPFGQFAPQITSSGPLAYAPSMHGTFSNGGTQASMSFAESSFMEMSEESAKKIAALQAKLDKKLGPEYISQRPGPGGGPKLTYAEGWKIINLANEVFGFNGWSSNIVSLTTDFIDFNEQSQRYTVGVTAIIKITLRDGVFHEDIGYGMLENSKSKGAALDKCKKEAVTDGVKRALRNFGNLLGNCLYDKAYAQEVVKIKVPPPKLDKSELHRRPEFEEKRQDGPVDAPPRQALNSTAGPSGVTSIPDTNIYIDTPPQPAPSRPLSSVPSHMRGMSCANASSASHKGKSPLGLAEHSTSTPIRSNNAQQSKTGLHTPIHTPAAHAVPQRTNVAAATGVVYRQAAQSKPDQSATSGPPNDKRVDFNQPQVEPSKPPPPEEPSPTNEEPVMQSGSFDEYGLNSEDDAFFATVDLGEGDSGIGGHIDFDEGTGVPDPIEQDHSAPTMPNCDPPPPPPSQFIARPNQPFRQPGKSRVQLTTSGQRAPNQNTAVTGDFNRPPGATSAMTPTPSLGGFRFPPGVSFQNPRPGSSVLKRSADTMQASDGRRPLQGMGLSHQSAATGNSTRREPLAPLEVSEGGDLKRARR